MKHTTKILKATLTILVLLFVTVFTVTTKASLSADESTDGEQQKKTVKYSKFFDEKKHWCDALVITCTDFRFTTATQEFINDRLGLKGKYDYISIPGSIRNLMDSKTRDLVLNTFGVSFRLHHVKRVVILAHQDCTIGYGGSKSFTEPEVEYKTICKDLKKARRLFGIKFPHLRVDLYYGTVYNNEDKRIYNFKQIL
ncbi:MAG: hypothetical protein Q6358_03140 [Candidatus Brocadiales bacterium]|uniref:carbonic anhydrase n=1 Tax=Candidatus Wunengus sp. YC60 TaxID=3367697 RepID=UPI002713A07C|nr:hypothetical protein [Candidatus Brocadiales bacterium]